jgi:hypothetical protein
LARAVEKRRRHRRRPKQRQEEAMREHGILAKKINVIVNKDKITEKRPKDSSIMDRLHWRRLRDNAGDIDTHYLLAFATLGVAT